MKIFFTGSYNYIGMKIPIIMPMTDEDGILIIVSDGLDLLEYIQNFVKIYKVYKII
jgi:hypothetical protein